MEVLERSDEIHLLGKRTVGVIRNPFRGSEMFLNGVFIAGEMRL